MVDSAVGGKTGIDRPHGKNLVGAFHQPSLVLADPEALDTLPPRELRAGLAEVVKAAWIEGESDVAALERDAEALVAGGDEGRAARTRAIRRAIRTKARIVAADEGERGLRRALNLGHTLGHAVEAASGYALVHGEAVAIGLVAALRLSVELGRAEHAHLERLRSLLERLGLSTGWPSYTGAQLRGFLAVDKKAVGGAVRLVTAGAPGDVGGGLAIDREQVLSSVDGWCGG
ncbi:MAG: 3-dehydroquinate synthase [Planctomycetes bacterium]|nr:3-dehydroquinate synthase [Planctomycetota bacterium]